MQQTILNVLLGALVFVLIGVALQLNQIATELKPFYVFTGGSLAVINSLVKEGEKMEAQRKAVNVSKAPARATPIPRDRARD